MKGHGCRWLGILCLLAVFFFLAASAPAHSQQEKVVKLKYASWFPPVHKVSVLSEQWCREVEKRTNGRIKITYLPGGTLVPGPQGYEGAVRGIADISVAAQTWTAGRFPLSEVIELPLGFTNALQATRLANAFYKKFKPKEYDDAKVLYLYNSAPGVFLTAKPVATIEGLKGIKIRAGATQTRIVSAMGGVPVSVPISDIYEGLQRGVIDGICFYAEALKGFRFGDVIRGMQDNPGLGFAGAGIFVMNKNKWNSLPPDIQKIIDQINEEWIDKQGNVWVEADKEGREFGLSKGMKIFKASPEEVRISAERMKPILEAYVKDMKAKGLPGEEALKFCQDYIKTHP